MDYFKPHLRSKLLRTGLSICVSALCASLMTSGCAYYKQLNYRPAEQLPPEWLSYYNYPKLTFDGQAAERVVEKRDRYVIRQIEFPMSVPEDLLDRSWEDIRREWEGFDEKEKQKGKDLEYKVRIDFYEQLETEPRPLIIVSPILGGDNQVAEIFSAFFARNGFHAAILHRQKLKVDREKSLDQVERYLHLAVIRALQGVEWLRQQKSVDPDRMATFGISFGGIVNTFLAGTDPRMKAHVIAMAGGNLAHVIVNCPENPIRPQVEYLIKEKGWSKETLQSTLHEGLRTDTLTFARAVDAEKVLMFISVFDQVINRKLQRNLWKAMGEPEAVFFPFGHYTSFIVMPYIAYRSLKFFRKKLLDPEPMGNQGVFPRGIYTPHPLFQG